MDAKNNKIRVILTPKANKILSNIVKKYNLDEFEGAEEIDYLSKELSLGNFSESQGMEYLERELKIAKQMSGQIVKDIKAQIVPLVFKALENDFENPVKREEISEKIFGPEKKLATQKAPLPLGEIKNPAARVSVSSLPKSSPKIIEKKIIEEAKIVQSPKQQSGPDKYREEL